MATSTGRTVAVLTMAVLAGGVPHATGGCNRSSEPECVTSAQLAPPGTLVVTPANPNAPSWRVNVSFGAAPPQGAIVRVLSKPMGSEAEWTAVDATGSDTAWSATIPSTGVGALFAVEIAGAPGQGWRLPDVLTEAPYRTLAP